MFEIAVLIALCIAAALGSLVIVLSKTALIVRPPTAPDHGRAVGTQTAVAGGGTTLTAEEPGAIATPFDPTSPLKVCVISPRGMAPVSEIGPCAVVI